MAYSIFLDNKYTKWYASIVSNAKDRNWSKSNATCYTEDHHVIPKSLGGIDSVDNLITVTAKEHFILHLLLTKMCNGEHKNKMVWAMHRMAFSESPNQNRNITSAKYNLARKIFSENQRQTMTGRKLSEETKYKIKEARSKQICSEETRSKMSKTRKSLVWMYNAETLKNTRVNEDRVNDMINSGYVLGRYGLITEDMRKKLSNAASEQWKRQRG